MNELKDNNLEKCERFWREIINKDIKKSSFSDKTIYNNKVRYSNIEFIIPKEVANKILLVCNNSSIAIYIYMISAIEYMLKVYSGNCDVVIGTEAVTKEGKNNGQHPKVLMFKSSINEEDTFKEFLSQSKEMFVNINKFKDLNVQQINRVVGVEEFDNKTEIIDTIVRLRNISSNEEFKGFDVSTIFEFQVEDNNISCSIKYNANSISETKINAIKNNLLSFLDQTAGKANIKLKMIDIILQEEKNRLLLLGKGKKIPFNEKETLNDLFERQVEKTPNNIAVKHLNHELTYFELNNKANKIANRLMESGLKKGEVVGLYFERSIEMIIGIIATLKAGGVYLPINIDNPSDRVKYLLNDSNAKKILTNINFKDKIDFINERDIIIIDNNMVNEIVSNPKINISSDGLAYIIYTSGTTGEPKGVMIKHKNVINLILGLQDSIYNNYEGKLNITCLAPYYFDASVQQIFMSLINGHKLIIPTESEKMTGDSLLDFYYKNEVEVSDGTPSHINMISSALKKDYARLSVKHFIIGGEKLNYSLINSFFDNIDLKSVKINNIYGPTECCVDNATFLISKENLEELDNNIIPIGNPLANQNIYVLDKNLNFAPFGVMGEIYISGNGVGVGYLNSKDLTLSKFIQDPFNKNLVMYKTGDLGRWNYKGYVECIGRMDSQVKIRGYRIELGEIENTILSFKKKKKMVNDEIITCKRCLITSAYPNITFNADGICNVCEEYEGYKWQVEDYFKEINDFKTIMNKAKKEKKGEYDCMLLYSGGKDSTYVLYHLVEMGYKVLAFTFDNGYISERAFRNIKKITSNLNVHSVIHSCKNMNEIFIESLKDNSTVCTGCFKALTTVSTKIAFENNINVIVTGLSRGQIMDTKLQHIMKAGIYDKENIDNKLLDFRKIYHSINDRTNELLDIKLEDNKFENTYFIDFFRYANSSSDIIIKYLLERDEEWSAPKDTGFCSSNCLINDVGIYMHLKNKGFHNYMIPISWDCRLGLATKESAAKELDDNFNMESINNMIKKLGYENYSKKEKIIEEAVVLDKLDAFGNSYLIAYYVCKEKILIADLRRYLMEKLPEYEVPSFYLQVNNIPKTANGKIDRMRLFKMKVSGYSSSKYEAPTNKTEELLVDIWTDILEVDGIGIKDSFFELGGHSLNAMVLVASIQKDFKVSILITDILELMTIENIAKYIDENKFNEYSYEFLTNVDEREFYPVSSSQKRMFILQSLNPLDTAYNVQSVKKIKGELDIKKLENCFLNLVNRHEALRTSFKFNNDEVVQIINEEVNFNIEVIEQHNKNIDNLIEDFVRPFDLGKAPLIRVGVVKSQDGDYIMMLDIHHICTDAMTLKILINELSLLYNKETLPNVEFQYKDFACWQRGLLQTPSIQKQKEYWYNSLSNYDFKRNIFNKYSLNYRNEGRLKRVKFNIGNTLRSQLENLAQSNKVTLYMVLLTAYNILLYRFSSEEDIIIGTPIAGRHHAKLDKIVGVFINTLVIRNFPNSNKTARELLNEVKETVSNAFKNQDYPFDDIVNGLNIERNGIKNPLFNIMFVLNNINYKELNLSQLEVTEYNIKNSKVMMDMVLEVEILNDELTFTFEYNDVIFSKNLMDKFIYNYIKILRSIIYYDVKISDIDLEEF